MIVLAPTFSGILFFGWLYIPPRAAKASESTETVLGFIPENFSVMGFKNLSAFFLYESSTMVVYKKVIIKVLSCPFSLPYAIRALHL